MSEITTFYSDWLGCSAFGGSSVRLRDQEPLIFNPLDISGCVIWMEANDSRTVNYDTFLQVGLWSNKGTLGGTFDISGTGLVEYGVDKVNGLNVLSFRSNGFLSGTFNLDFQDRSVFLVIKPNSFPSSTPIPIFSSDNTGAQETVFSLNGTWTWFEGKHGSPFPQTAFESLTDYTGYASLAEIVVSTDLSNNWTGINGTYIPPIYQSAASYSTAPALYYLGNFFNGSPVPADVDMCEILMYNGVLSAADREQIETYLRVKWALAEPPIPPIPPAPFSPKDYPGLQLWMDAANAASFTFSNADVLSWSNLGLEGSSFDAYNNAVARSKDSNDFNFVRFASQSQLAGYFTFAYKTRTALAVFKNESPLDSIAYPFINLIDTSYYAGRQLVAAYDSNSSNYYLQMCQQGINCPANGLLPVPLDSNTTYLGIWSVDSNTNLSNLCYFNGGSNINTSTDTGNQFDTTLGYYFMGSANVGSPNFQVGEILEYENQLTLAQLSTVCNYLVVKWAISSFVPLS